MQKIRLFHLFSFEIQSILESQDHSDHPRPVPRLATPIFDHANPINFWSAFSCHESASTYKKITLFHLFILQIESILEPHHMTGHIHFLTIPTPKIFNVCYNQLKSVNSWDTVNFRFQRPDLFNLLWRNSSFRNYAIWLAQSILACISGTRFFPI